VTGPARRLWAGYAAALLAAAPACWRGGELTESGKGLPVVAVDFPQNAAPGSVQTAVLSVENPGPGDIARVVVTFVRVGAPAAEGLPNPIVDPGRSPDSGEVVGVHPEPRSVSPDGLAFRFGALGEGEEMTIEFDLRVPEVAGIAANSVTVYDDLEPPRARGVRLETTVQG
jgi:hypothetical protein